MDQKRWIFLVIDKPTKILVKKRHLLSTENGSSPWSYWGPDSWSVKNVDLVNALKLFRYLQNYQSYGLGSVILRSTRSWNCPWSCLGPDLWSVRKVDLVKVLELFSYLQNYQSYGLESGILLPTGNGSSPWLCLAPDSWSVKKSWYSKSVRII